MFVRLWFWLCARRTQLHIDHVPVDSYPICTVHVFIVLHLWDEFARFTLRLVCIISLGLVHPYPHQAPGTAADIGAVDLQELALWLAADGETVGALRGLGKRRRHAFGDPNRQFAEIIEERWSGMLAKITEVPAYRAAR